MRTAALLDRTGRLLKLLLAFSLVGCSRSQAAERNYEAVLVSNEDSGDVSIIDPSGARATRSIPVGKRPRGVRINPDKNLLYVALSGSPKGGPNVDESRLPPADRAADGIGVVELAGLRLLRTLPSGKDPESFDLAGDELIVSNEDSALASFVNLRSGAVEAEVPVGAEPEGVTTSPNRRVIYVTSEAGGEVHVIDRALRRVTARIKVGQRPRAVAFTADGARAYVTNELDSTVSVVDARHHRLLQTISIPPPSRDAAPPRPMGIVIAPDAEHAYVTTGRGGGVAELELRGNSYVRTLTGVGARPWGIAQSPDGKRLYVANGPTNDLSLIDVATFEVVRRIPAGRSPWGVAVTKLSATR